MENFLGTWFPNGSTLTFVDILLFFIFVGGLLFVGFYYGKSDETTDDFFLAHRAFPPWMASVSFVSTEVNAMMLIGIPAIAFRENWQYAQFFVGVVAARIFIIRYFVPVLYHYRCVTIYEYLKHRFGVVTQVSASIFFILTRLLNSGVRLMAASMAVSVLLGWPIVASILLFSVVGTAYVVYGGIRAAVWANIFQAATFVLAGVAIVLVLIHYIQGGIGAVWGIAEASGRLSLWNFGSSASDLGFIDRFFSDPNVLWMAVLNGFIGSLATIGTDQEMMQRVLLGKTPQESRQTLLYSIPASFFVMVLYLLVGTGIFAYYSQHPEFALPKEVDKILPHFTVQVLPVVLRGLVLAAIFMASVDLPVNSIAASFVEDIYKPLIRKEASEVHYMYVSRAAVIVAGLLLTILACYFSYHEQRLWLGFKIAAVTFGPLLGVFLLGLLTQRQAVILPGIAMLGVGAFNLWLLSLSEREIFLVGWNWLMVFGAAATFGIGWGWEPALQRMRGRFFKPSIQ